jgi:hypothetical protein
MVSPELTEDGDRRHAERQSGFGGFAWTRLGLHLKIRPIFITASSSAPVSWLH